MNAVIQDWDTYGAMSHNYYLYHDPETDRLVWISWDHNEAFSSRGRGDTSLDKASVGDNWPLIRYRWTIQPTKPRIWPICKARSPTLLCPTRWCKRSIHGLNCFSRMLKKPIKRSRSTRPSST